METQTIAGKTVEWLVLKREALGFLEPLAMRDRKWLGHLAFRSLQNFYKTIQQSSCSSAPECSQQSANRI